MKKNTNTDNYYRISQIDIIAIDTLIEYLQYGVLSLLKQQPLQQVNEDSIGLDEYEAHLEKINKFAETLFPSKGNRQNS